MRARGVLTAREIVLVLSVQTVAEFVALVLVRYTNVGLGAQERVAVAHFEACVDGREDRKKKNEKQKKKIEQNTISRDTRRRRIVRRPAYRGSGTG